MKTIAQAITGDECQAQEATPYAALVNFYKAFNQRDLGMMQANWLQSEQSSMANPLGGIKRGWTQIEQVYRNIFNGSARVYVEFYDYSLHEFGDGFVVVGRERGHLRLAEQCMTLAIRTSRSYVRKDDAWKQIHHHGSMDDAVLLSNYQKIILGH